MNHMILYYNLANSPKAKISMMPAIGHAGPVVGQNRLEIEDDAQWLTLALTDDQLRRLQCTIDGQLHDLAVTVATGEAGDVGQTGAGAGVTGDEA